MNQLKDIANYISFLLKKRWVHIIVVIIVFCLMYLKTADSQIEGGLDWWENWLDPIIGVGTIFVAWFVWFGNASQERVENLPKKLTVRFYHKGNLILLCENAYLSDEGDIRAWGQQIGSQMCHKNHLDFKPFIRENPIQKQYDKEGNSYLLYEVIFYLNALPEIRDKAIEKDFHQKFQTQYRRWRPDENNPENIDDDWIPREEK
ncbi:MAG: hypothetical protein ACPG49_11880 [Chitinophagales bacterium]